MKTNLDNYECDGQTNIFDFLTKSVEYKGLMDYPYCPECKSYFKDEEIDAKQCPECGTLLDWKRWHEISGE